MHLILQKDNDVPPRAVLAVSVDYNLVLHAQVSNRSARGGGGVWVHLPKVLALKLQKICSHSPRQEEWRRRCRRSREGRGKGWGEESGHWGVLEGRGEESGWCTCLRFLPS